jgi:branched-chain amino acid transport system permease protein
MNVGLILTSALREAFGPTAAWFALLVIGLNVHYGYTGLLNFGQAGFAMVGAYGVGVFVNYFGWSLWAAIPMGLLGGLLLALVLGVPTLRLRGDYFAITTIAAAEILRTAIQSSWAAPMTGGTAGIGDVAGDFHRTNPFDQGVDIVGVWSYLSSDVWSGLWTWVMVIAMAFIVYLLMRSPWGRVLRAIREDEDAARALGKNVVAYKLQSLSLGGVIGALAGIMLTLQTSSVVDESFQPRVTFFAYAALLLGGAATTWGPVIGSMLFWFLFTFSTQLLAGMRNEGWLPSFLGGSASGGIIVLAVVGLTIIVLMIYRPQGLFGNRRELMLDV